MDKFMDAKYNRYLDSALVRFGVTALVFGVWLGASYGLLKMV